MHNHGNRKVVNLSTNLDVQSPSNAWNKTPNQVEEEMSRMQSRNKMEQRVKED